MYQPEKYDEATGTGRWKYLEKLGEGSYGYCWKAQDMHGKQAGLVVIKVSKYRKGSAPGFMLHREAMCSIRHIHCRAARGYNPHKAALFAEYIEDQTSYRHLTREQDIKKQLDSLTIKWDCGKLESADASETDYVVMRFYEGASLRRVVAARAFTVQTARMLFSACCTALEYLSELELVHRDFRSANLLWDGTQIMVLDLGLMLPYRDDMSSNTSAVNMVPVCSRNYWMPPEVHDGARNFGFLSEKKRSWTFDVFSLGAMLCEICSPRQESTNDASHFHNMLCNPQDPQLLEIQAFWRGLGIIDDVLPLMLRKDFQHRPSPRELRYGIGSDADILVSVVGENKLHLAEQKACSFCGALKLLENVKEDKRDKMLDRMCTWLNEGGAKSWSYAYARIEQLADERFSSAPGILEEMAKRVPKDAEALEQLQGTKQKVADLVSASDSRRSCLSTTVPSVASRQSTMSDFDRVAAAGLRNFEEAFESGRLHMDLKKPSRSNLPRLKRSLTEPLDIKPAPRRPDAEVLTLRDLQLRRSNTILSRRSCPTPTVSTGKSSQSDSLRRSRTQGFPRGTPLPVMHGKKALFQRDLELRRSCKLFLQRMPADESGPKRRKVVPPCRSSEACVGLENRPPFSSPEKHSECTEVA